MKHLLFFISGLGSGGAQRQIVELAVGFKGMGYNVRFLIYQKKWSEFYYQYIVNHGIEIDGIYEDNYLKRIYKVRRYIRSHKFDVVIAFLEAPSFMAELSGFPSRKWKLIVGERSADPAKRSSFKLRLFLKFRRFADYIVANSYANINIVKEVAPGILSRKFNVIYNMLDKERLLPNENFTYRKNGKLNLLVASSHRYLKNLNGLIEGVHLMDSQYRDNLRISWFGNSRFDTSLEDGLQKIQSYGLQDIFSFHKETLNIYDYMREADAVGLFSFFEGLPNAICEGMYMGKPIVATRVSDVPLLVEDNVNGFLCEANSPSSISHALTLLVKCSVVELSDMGKRNNTKAEELFNKSRILGDYEKMF